MAALVRRLGRAPFAATISVATLALGLACFVAAHAVAGFWQRSERHFANVERIFVISTDLRFDDGSLATGAMPLTNEHVARYLAADYPQLTAVARARVISDHAMVATEQRAARLYRVAVDPEFGEIFDLPFLAGDPRSALAKPRSVVLTREAAERLFGDQDPIGQPVLLSNSTWATVTGVIAPIPEPLLMVTGVAGGYPALVLSRLPPVSMLRQGGAPASRRLWRLLLGAQFAVASFLSIAAIVTYQQNGALRQAALRQGDDPVVVIENFYTVTELHPDTLQEALLGMPQVSGVTSMASAPWGGINVLPLSESPVDSTAPSTALWHIVGYDFFATFDIAVIAGRVFQRDRGEEALPFMHHATQPNNVVLSRSLVRELRLGSPEEAVDRLIYVPKGLLLGFGGSAAQPLRIIGVVEDEPLTSITVGPRSSVYTFAEPLPFQAAKIRRDQLANALSAIDALWQRLLPNAALHRRLTDEIFAEKHRNFERLYRSFATLAVFAFLIAAVGLFAMAAALTRGRRYPAATAAALIKRPCSNTAELAGRAD